MVRGAANVTINCGPTVVFDIITDISRMGEWSPECTGGEWLPPAYGPAVGAEFTGHNVAKLGPVPIKKWTTTSRVTAARPGELFEFVSADYTTWRYELIEIDGTTRLTETFSHAPYEGFKSLLYDKIVKRTPSMIKGMEDTLAALKKVVEADARCAGSVKR